MGFLPHFELERPSNCEIDDDDDVRPSLAKKTMTSYHCEVEWVRGWLKSPIFARKCLLQCGQGMLGAGPVWGFELLSLSSLANLIFSWMRFASKASTPVLTSECHAGRSLALASHVE